MPCWIWKRGQKGSLFTQRVNREDRGRNPRQFLRRDRLSTRALRAQPDGLARCARSNRRVAFGSGSRCRSVRRRKLASLGQATPCAPPYPAATGRVTQLA